jgi:hypothetical protein
VPRKLAGLDRGPVRRTLEAPGVIEEFRAVGGVAASAANKDSIEPTDAVLPALDTTGAIVPSFLPQETI